MRRLAEFAGLGLILAGVGLAWPPAAFLLAGLGLVLWSQGAEHPARSSGAYALEDFERADRFTAPMESLRLRADAAPAVRRSVAAARRVATVPRLARPIASPAARPFRSAGQFIAQAKRSLQ